MFNGFSAAERRRFVITIVVNFYAKAIGSTNTKIAIAGVQNERKITAH